MEVAKTNTSFFVSKTLGTWLYSVLFCHSYNT